jgi:hypothetical protein
MNENKKNKVDTSIKKNAEIHNSEMLENLKHPNYSWFERNISIPIWYRFICRYFNVMEWKRQLKYLYHRAFCGYDDRDAWSMDYAFLKWYVKTATILADATHGCPMEMHDLFFDGSISDSTKNGKNPLIAYANPENGRVIDGEKKHFDMNGEQFLTLTNFEIWKTEIWHSIHLAKDILTDFDGDNSDRFSDHEQIRKSFAINEEKRKLFFKWFSLHAGELWD